MARKTKTVVRGVCGSSLRCIGKQGLEHVLGKSQGEPGNKHKPGSGQGWARTGQGAARKEARAAIEQPRGSHGEPGGASKEPERNS